MKKVLCVVFLLVLLCACQAPARGGSQTVPTATGPAATASPTNPIAPPPETIVAPTLAPDPTATSETRLPPEDWREWPVVPAVTPRAIEIYRTGLGMGLDPHAFSKVGDCQSVKAAFLGYFDIPERYSLGPDTYLQKTIDNFSGHFNTDGQAVRGGFNAAAVLSPLWADPKACLPGENPLECELRITKPIIVIVSLEVWWNGRTPEQYEKLMRQILDTIIAHGAVPILATKADNVEGNNSLNLTTARLAYEYDLPLWNFWAAVQPLPAHGMDMQRNDGFHISTAAWSVRSFTGLEALDSVWRGLLTAAPTAAATPTADLTATPAPLATLVGTLFPTPAAGTAVPGSSGRIVFGLASHQGEGYQYLGVYQFDPAARQARQLFGNGIQYQSGSPDGKFLLVSQGPTLYRTDSDGANPVRLTDSLYAYGNTAAVWLPGGQIAAVLTGSAGTELAVLSADGASVKELSTALAPIGVYRSSTSKYIYWETGSCKSPGVCQAAGPWVTSLDGSMDQALFGLLNPVISPDDLTLASAISSTTAQSNLVFSAPDGTQPRPFHFPGNQLLDYAWSPGGDQLAAVVAVVDSYTGKATGNRNFLVDPHTLAIREYSLSKLLHPQVLWSPDGSSLFWLGTLPDGSDFKISGSLVDLSTKQVTDLGSALGESSPDYLVITNTDWLPMP